jgi:hypothetical protein
MPPVPGACIVSDALQNVRQRNDPSGGQGGPLHEVKDVKLRRENIVTALALLVIAAALPFAIMDTLETGRVYLFSIQFLEELPQRFTGPGRLRFILQPVIAILLGMRGGLADARAGNPPYLYGLLFHAGRRRELMQSGVAAISTLLAMGIILDVVFQFVLYRAVHPGAALVVGPILICVPYSVSRALTNRLALLLGKKPG